MDYAKINEAAMGYKDDMTKFLRDLVRIPGESCGEKGHIMRIKEEMEKVGFDKVQIDLLREVKYGTFDKVGRVERDIQVPVKTERFGIKGGESKVRTGFTADLQGIHQIIFVESCPDAG